MSSTRHAASGDALLWARRAMAVFFVLHGIAHLVGAQEALRAAGDGTSVPHLLDAWQVGGPSLYVMAAGWIATAAAYGVAAVWLWWLRPGWWGLAVSVTSASLILSVLALPQAIIGVVINVVLLTWAAALRRTASGQALRSRS